MEVYKDYGWEKPETEAHGYLIPSVIKILHEVELPKDALILDAGCGAGELVNRLHSMGYRNVYGFDASESGIKVARERFPHIEDRFFLHNAYDENFPERMPASFDCVITMEVIEHLYDPQRFLTNLKRHLKKGGYLILTTPYHGLLKNIAIILFGKFDTHFDPLWTGGHIKFFTRRTIHRILTDTGFSIIRIDGAGRFWPLWKSMIVVSKVQ